MRRGGKGKIPALLPFGNPIPPCGSINVAFAEVRSELYKRQAAEYNGGVIESLKLTLCLTRDCLLRCRYCYAGDKCKVAMSRETAEKAICLAVQEAVGRGWSIDLGFFGGEPLMEWELLQHCDAYLRAQAAALPAPPRFTVTTNGLLLTPERAEWLAEHRYMTLLSIDGHAPMHRLNRVYADGRDSHAAAARALAVAGAARGLMTQVVCVVSPNNVHLLKEGVQWLAAHHRGPIALNFDFWADWNEAQLCTAAEQYGLCAELMCRSFREGQPIMVDALMSKMYSLLNGGYHSCDFCRMGEREICVSAEGHILPCSRLVGEMNNPDVVLGDVNAGMNRAKAALLSARSRQYAAACLSCACRPHCIHWCGCSNYAGTRNVATPSRAACLTEQRLIALAETMLTTLRRENNAVLRQYFGHLPRFEMV